MTSVFLNYSKYYDLIYQDKDYLSEVKFISSLIHEFAPKAETILNLGCGTGNHDFLLATEGYKVTGVDLSETMIEVAKTKNSTSQCKFMQGDVRKTQLNKKFDVVISLFHVMSYQNSNQDVKDFFKTIHDHLKPGGIAIFDYWYGPAVLSIKPEKRIKKFESEEIKVERIATTETDFNKNIATVKYDIEIKDQKSSKEEHLTEYHPMRYFFSPEIELFLEMHQLKTIQQAVWLEPLQKPSEASWSAYSVVRS